MLVRDPLPAPVDISAPSLKSLATTIRHFMGTERESVKRLILGRILQNHELSPAGRHVLGL
jgi:hypothetical protein